MQGHKLSKEQRIALEGDITSYIGEGCMARAITYPLIKQLKEDPTFLETFSHHSVSGTDDGTAKKRKDKCNKIFRKG